MSSLHNQPHEVDVPITDLDDDNDIFSIGDEEDDHMSPLPSEGLSMDQFDFEIEEPMVGNSGNKFSRMFLGLGNKLFGGFKEETNYERVTGVPYLDGMDSDSLDSEDEVAFHLRDYKIKMLKKRVKKIGLHVLLVLVCMMGILAYMLFTMAGSRKGSSTGYKDPKTGKTILSNSTHDFFPTTLLISLDGFHPHYISPSNTPTMHKLFVEEFGAPYMIPSFPSSTFPNHWTLITGLYPSEHGIVGNTFYDPLLKKQFINTNPKIGGLDPEFWGGGEPIWRTAFNQGVNSAIHMWPGSEVPGIGIDGGGPLYVDRYNGSELLTTKVDRIFNWLDIEEMEKRPELLLTYVPTIDLYGHKYGISGDELVEALTYVDDFIDLIQLELRKRNLQNLVNLVIVSDHGMAPTSNKRLLYLDDLVDLNKIEHIDGWPLFGLRPKQEFSVDDIYNELKDQLSKQSKETVANYDIYKLEDVPPEFEFGGAGNHKFDYRLAPIWIIPHVGYSVTTHKQMDNDGGEYKPKGVHGYNNTELLMRAVFLAQGPYFDKLKNKKIYPFRNTEVYNLICDTMEIKPSPNNGTSNLSPFAAKLPKSWKDNLTYPNLNFDVDHIIKDDATYDLLFRNFKAEDHRPTLTSVRMSTNARPLESLLSEESTFTSVSEHLPKPTDFEVDNNHPEPESDNEHGDSGDDDDEGDKKVPGIFGDIENAFEDAVEAVGEVIDGAADTISDLWGNVFGGEKSN